MGSERVDVVRDGRSTVRQRPLLADTRRPTSASRTEVRSKAPVLSVLLPVFNEAATLDALLDQLLAVPFGYPFEVIAVDDASTDGSYRILENRRSRVLRIAHHRTNRGKGAAVRTALEASRGRMVVIQDADLEYDPAQLPALVEPVRVGDADVVYGSRFLGSIDGMRRRNRAANQVLSALASGLYGARLTDIETCYKVMARQTMVDLRLESKAFDLEPEVTARLLRRGHTITELPIAYDGRSLADGKKIGFDDGVAAILTLLRWRFRPNP